MGEFICFERFIAQEELVNVLKNITFRGLYTKEGTPIKPYARARFSLVTVHPPPRPTSFPQIMHNMQPQPLFTAQPTIYKSQTDMLLEVEQFLESIGKSIQGLKFEGVQYHWKGKGTFHILPPIVEKHTYSLAKGFFNLKKMAERFRGCYVKDAQGNFHEVSKRLLRDYYVDKDSKFSYLDLFNHNAALINYGLRFDGDSDFYVIADGSHRMDLALELMNKPISVILVEPEEGEVLYPYYAFPMPFRPTTRLTSKDAERMYPRLERDKIHLFNEFLKKVLHYDWEAGGLHVSELRTPLPIH